MESESKGSEGFFFLPILLLLLLFLSLAGTSPYSSGSGFHVTSGNQDSSVHPRPFKTWAHKNAGILPVALVKAKVFTQCLVMETT